MVQINQLFSIGKPDYTMLTQVQRCDRTQCFRIVELVWSYSLFEWGSLHLQLGDITDLAHCFDSYLFVYYCGRVGPALKRRLNNVRRSSSVVQRGWA